MKRCGRDDSESTVTSAGTTLDHVGARVNGDPVTVLSVRVAIVTVIASTLVAMGLAILRLRHGLSLVGDSGSYLAGASGFAEGRWFETPLTPSFSEIPLLDTVDATGWSPFTDFGVGTPLMIAFCDLFLPLRHAAGAVNVLAIGSIAVAVMVGPWAPQRRSELAARSIVAVGLSCWPILRFTGVAVLSEPLFCAAVLWLTVILGRLATRHRLARGPESAVHAPHPSSTESPTGFAHPRMLEPRAPVLVALGALTLIAGFTRFVGPSVALVVALVLVGQGMSWRRAGWWFLAAGLAPTAVTALASDGTRTWSFHPRGTDDIFFLARGFAGWFEAGMGNQTTTLLRQSFRPSPVEWVIALTAASGAVVVMYIWSRSLYQERIRNARARTGSSGTTATTGSILDPALGPALILATALTVVVVPSMFFLDAILKLENRIMMPSGILVISAAGWWLAARASVLLALGGVGLWAIVATHPWAWLERPAASEPTALTRAVDELRTNDAVQYVVTNQADLTWWHTGVPARYLPSGYYNRSDQTYDPRPILANLACALSRNNGVIVVDTNVGLPGPVTLEGEMTEGSDEPLDEEISLENELALDVTAGRYDRFEITPGIEVYLPTGLGCD